VFDWTHSEFVAHAKDAAEVATSVLRDDLALPSLLLLQPADEDAVAGTPFESWSDGMPFIAAGGPIGPALGLWEYAISRTQAARCAVVVFANLVDVQVAHLSVAEVREILRDPHRAAAITGPGTLREVCQLVVLDPSHNQPLAFQAGVIRGASDAGEVLLGAWLHDDSEFVSHLTDRLSGALRRVDS
jgi:hypothetical protein